MTKVLAFRILGVEPGGFGPNASFHERAAKRAGLSLFTVRYELFGKHGRKWGPIQRASMRTAKDELDAAMTIQSWLHELGYTQQLDD